MYRVLALALFALLLPLQAAMARDHDRDGARRLDQILPAVRHAYPGTFYDAEGPFESRDGRLLYRLKWLLPSGRIVWLEVDARSGAVLGQVRAGGANGPEPYRPESYPSGRQGRDSFDRDHDAPHFAPRYDGDRGRGWRDDDDRGRSRDRDRSHSWPH